MFLLKASDDVFNKYKLNVTMYCINEDNIILI